MTSQHGHPYQLVAGASLLALALPLLWWVTGQAGQAAPELPGFAPWHLATELLAVVVAMLVFVTGYRAILSPRKGAVVLLGVLFLGVGLLGFLHTISQPGTAALVTDNTIHKSMTFGLSARLLAAVALLLYALLPAVPDVSPPRKRLATALVLAIVCAFGLIGLFRPEQIPLLYVANQGPTPLATGLGWLTTSLNLVTVLVLWRRWETLARECVLALALAAALLAVSSLFYLMSALPDQDLPGVLSHLYKVLAYLFLFHATFNESVNRPLELMATQGLREKLVLSAAPDGVLWVDDQGQILMSNPAMETLTGYSSEELVGQNVSLFLPLHLRATHAQSIQHYFHAPNERAMGLMDLRLMRKDGELLPVDISLGHWENGNERFAIAYIRDLTDRKKFEESLRHKATHDELTGLPNRWLFRLQLNQAIAHAKRSKGRIAVLFLDLDNFKAINDSYGHLSGDQLLSQVASTLRRLLRENDLLARLGGDEFAILLQDMEMTDEALNVATKVLSVFESSYRLQDQDVLAGCSIGIAFYPDDAQDSETLLRYADMAMYQAKQAGRGTYACYATELDSRARDNMVLQVRLKEAIKNNRLKLLYQPQVDVQSGKVVGCEALLRWHDEVLGDVSPARFIPIAESTGLILPLSEWVLETACQQIAAWSQGGTPLRVAVNFSAQQFRQHNLPDKIAAALQRTGASASLLEVEITESVAMSQPLQASAQLNALVALGCSVSLDDFGTGYSSLAYLKALPVSKLKIDRSFIKDIPHDESDVKISRSIIALAHSLGLSVVAEGVETEEQLAFLRQHGCEAYQGWLFSKAISAADLTPQLLKPATS